MATIMTKRKKKMIEMTAAQQFYTPEEAIELLKVAPKVNFDQTVEVAVVLGVDAKKSDQTVRGAVVLPHGTGKTVRVAVFTGADKEKLAKEAGADIVGLEDLAAKVTKGEMDFDVVIASPDAMSVVGKLGQILGPRGLMPNPKVGTVTPDVATAVKNAKTGQVRFRADKGGIVHAIAGKLSFVAEQLVENLKAMLRGVIKAKPSTAKGTYIKKVCLSSTMGPGLKLDINKLD